MMANTNRIVLERIAEFDASNAAPSSSSPSSPSFRSLAISYDSESQKTLVYVGTDVATLILLSSNTNISTSDTKGHGLSFTRSTPIPIPISSSSGSSSSVDSIHAFEEIGRVIVLLSDGFVFSLDSHLLQPPTRLTFPRGVTVVAPRSRSRSRSRPRPSSSAMGNCVAAVAVGKRLILIELLLSNAQFLVLKEIQGIEGVKAMVWIDDSIIVATVAGYTQCSLVSGGQFTPIFNLPDPSSPPYLKCLPRDHQALLLIDNVGILVNRLGHPVGGSFIFRCVPDAAGDIASYLILVGDGAMDLYHKKTGCCVQSVSFAGKGIGLCTLATMEPAGHAEIVVAATASKIICFRKVSAEEQIKDLLRKKNFKEAITLVEELENEGELTRDMLSFVHTQVGFLLLFDMHFEEAINHFLLSETMQPSEIFPFIMRDPNRWSTLVPRNRYWGLHPPPVPLEDVIDEGMMTIQRAVFLRKAGVETSVDEEFIKNPPTRAYLLESAIKNVIRYLQVSRNKDLAPSVKEGVDTFLMYLYRVLNYVDEMEQLASSENSCVVEELETLLDGSGHLRTLAFLYASKGMSSKALAIWRILPRNYSVGLWKDPAIDDDDSLKNFISSQKVAATEASKLLEDSSDQDLVLQHLGWIADVDQALAIQILTSEKRTNQLSPEEVIGAIGSKKVDILQRYLQWLIEDQDSDDSQFHTLYALSLAKSALESVDNNVNLEKPDASARSRKKDISDSEEECATFRSTVRERLQLFLQSSDLYDPEEVLDLVEGSELWLEKAILYRKLGQETLVLQILALKLEDSEAAEQYCAEIGRPDAYMQLLDMYLDPQNGKEPMFNAAVRLLHNHGESLDPRQVLETLSPDMPLQLAADTILRMLRARVHHRCQCQIAHNLSRAINIDARLARLEERSRHVQINDESVCDSCHARLGTKLFAMYPDDAIVCYKCFRRLGESTSVSGRNFKRDIIFKPGWLVNH